MNVLAIRKMKMSFSQKLYTWTVKKGYSAGNYQLLDKESTIRMGFRRESSDPTQDEWSSSRYYWLLDEEFIRRRESRWDY
jgi:hypothetical protein